MKKLISKFLVWLKWFWAALDNTVDQYVEIAIDITEALKKIIDSPVDDVIAEILKRAIPGTMDDILIDKIKKLLETKLPEIILKLNIVKDISVIEDPNEQLKAILAGIKFDDEQAKAAFYHNVASMLINDMSDGELSWTEAVYLAEFIYNKKYKKS